jgi:polyhydroxyalkanoate synthesis regulator phasin
MEELIIMLRRLADGLEAQQQQQQKKVIDFSSLTEDDKRVLEDLFNVWYEQSYREVEKKLEDFSDKLDDLPDDITEVDLSAMKGSIEDLEEKVGELESRLEDIPDSRDFSKVMSKVDSMDCDALSDIDFDELAEALEFFRSLRAAVVGDAGGRKKTAA